MLAVAVAAVAAPWVAALGSGAAVASWPVAPALDRHRPDHHPLPGRALGRGLPHHGDGHGRDPWPGPVSRVGPRASRRRGSRKGWSTAGSSWGSCTPSVRSRKVPLVRWAADSIPDARRHRCSRALAFPLLKTIIEIVRRQPAVLPAGSAKLSEPDPLRSRRGGRRWAWDMG